jgi:hypothetical protein
VLVVYTGELEKDVVRMLPLTEIKPKGLDSRKECGLVSNVLRDVRRLVAISALPEAFSIIPLTGSSACHKPPR